MIVKFVILIISIIVTGKVIILNCGPHVAGLLFVPANMSSDKASRPCSIVKNFVIHYPEGAKATARFELVVKAPVYVTNMMLIEEVPPAFCLSDVKWSVATAIAQPIFRNKKADVRPQRFVGITPQPLAV